MVCSNQRDPAQRPARICESTASSTYTFVRILTLAARSLSFSGSTPWKSSANTSCFPRSPFMTM